MSLQLCQSTSALSGMHETHGITSSLQRIPSAHHGKRTVLVRLPTCWMLDRGTIPFRPRCGADTHVFPSPELTYYSGPKVINSVFNIAFRAAFGC